MMQMKVDNQDQPGPGPGPGHMRIQLAIIHYSPLRVPECGWVGYDRTSSAPGQRSSLSLGMATAICQARRPPKCYPFSEKS